MEPQYDLLQRRLEIINSVKRIITSNEKNAKGLRSMEERGFSDKGMLEKVIEVTAIQSDQLSKLAQMVLIYVSSDEFTSKLATMMVMEHEENKNK